MGAEFLEVRLYETLAAARGLRPVERDATVDLCCGLVDECTCLDIDHRGRAVRSAVQLMTGEMTPALEPTVRDELARLCEVEVVMRSRTS
jgi:hypothetical protein